MNDENEEYGTADEIYFAAEETAGGLELDLEEDVRNRFVGLVEDRYASAEQARDFDEKRWLTAYHNFRGIYNKNVRFRESEKSKVFVKVTKTKVLAAFGQLVDVIFGTGQFPIGVRETQSRLALQSTKLQQKQKPPHLSHPMMLVMPVMAEMSLSKLVKHLQPQKMYCLKQLQKQE
jgi:hypothetical protein